MSSTAPQLALKDLTNTITSQQMTYAKNKNVSVEIINDSSATHWCLSETQSTTPSESTCSGTDWLSSKPTHYTLSDSDGIKTIYLWVKDFAGNVISPSTSHTITLDRINPTPLSFSSPAINFETQGVNLPLTFTCEAGLDVVISGDVTEVTANCNSSPKTVNINLSGSGNHSSKTVVLTQTDLASNSTTTSRAFIKDTLAPSLSVVSPAANTEANGSLLIEGSCEDGLGISLSGAGLGSPSTTSCTSGQFSQLIQFSTGEGSKTITLSQTDSAGNTGTTSRNFINDTTPPSLAITSPSADTEAQSGVTLVGDCETGLDVSLTGSGLSAPVTATCSAGNFSQAVLFSSGEGPKTITATQTDVSGNSVSISTDFIRDNTPPSIAYTSPDEASLWQSTLTVTGTCESNYPVEFSGDLSADDTVTCLLGVFSKALTFSSGDGVKTIVISQSDAAENSTSISRGFLKDDTDPTLTWVSPAEASSFQNNLTVSGACETGLDIVFEGTGLNFDTTEICVGGSYSKLLSVTSGEGTKSIQISQTDAAGNTKLITRSFNRDTTPPVLTRLTGSHPAYAKTSSFSWSGSCEAGLSIEVSGDTSATVSCTSGAWSWTTPTESTEVERNYLLTQTDLAGNSTALSLRWTRDVTPPSFTLDQSSPLRTNSDQVVLTGDCEGNGLIQVSGDATGNINCSFGSYTYTTPAKTTDDTYTFTLTHFDLAGNTAVKTMNWQRDTSGPLFTLNNSEVMSSQNTVSFSGSCEAAFNVTVTGAATGSFSCPGSGTWSWTSPTITADGEHIFNFAQSDGVASTKHEGSWTRDTTGPSVTSLSLNNGESITGSYIVDIELSAVDTLTEITSFCFKRNSTTPPLSSDTCWRPVNGPTPGISPNKNISFSNYKYALDVSPGLYKVYAFVKDEAGNISNLSSSGDGAQGVDLAEITYFIDPAPLVKDVVAANTDAPSAPPTASETATPAGSSVIVKWHASDDVALPAAPIKIFYSDDGKTWNLIASNLLNSSNGGCVVNHAATTIDDDATGCYVWENAAPSNNFFTMRVSATDTAESETAVASNPLNSSRIKKLAGNTDPGTGGSGNAALFFANEMSHNSVGVNTLVVTRSGVLFYRDLQRGLIWVNPETGKQEVFIPTTGTSNGDGGPVANASVKEVLAITLDHQDRLLIYDADRIRRVNTGLSPMTIETIIGGGSSTASPEDPLQSKLSPAGSTYHAWVQMMPFFALPNGNIWFLSQNAGSTANGGHQVGIYDALTGLVTRHSFSGSGTYYDAGYDITNQGFSGLAVAYNPVDSSISAGLAQIRQSFTGSTHNQNFNFDSNFVSTAPHANNWIAGGYYGMKVAMSGKIYAYSGKSTFRISRYDPSTRAWTVIAGSGVEGECPDGTPALSCNMAPAGLFVNSDDQVFFVDNGAIRTIDGDGNVVTIMGQSMSWGEGELATSARLPQVIDLEKWTDNGTEKYVVLDRSSRRLREFTIGGTVHSLAGDGNNIVANTTAPASTQSLWLHYSYPSSFEMNPSGDIYFHRGGTMISRLDRATDRWIDLVGGGSEYVYTDDADGMLGNQLRISRYIATVFGINGNNILASTFDWKDGVTMNYLVKQYRLTDGLQSHFVGLGNDAPRIDDCPIGRPAELCGVNVNSGWVDAHYNSDRGEWYFRTGDSTTIRSLIPGGTVEALVNLPRGVNNFTYDNSGPDEILYYCSNGRLFKYNLTGGTGETQLPWDSPTISCTGRSLIYNEDRNSLIFIYTSDGLTGVAEYLNP